MTLEDMKRELRDNMFRVWLDAQISELKEFIRAEEISIEKFEKLTHDLYLLKAFPEDIETIREIIRDKEKDKRLLLDMLHKTERKKEELGSLR